MTREHDSRSHPAPHRDRVGKRLTLFAVCTGPLAWIVQLCAAFAFSSAPCFEAGERLLAQGGPHPVAAIVSFACLAIALVSLWLGLVYLRRTRSEANGGPHGLVETGQGRTRFLALWAIAFSGLFSALIAVNILLLLGMRPCAA